MEIYFSFVLIALTGATFTKDGSSVMYVCPPQCECDDDITIVSCINVDMGALHWPQNVPRRLAHIEINCKHGSQEFDMTERLFTRGESLKHVEFYGCPLKTVLPKAFSGLRNIETLVLDGYNPDTVNRSGISINDQAFDGLQELRALTITWQNLRSFPARLLCKLEHIEFLDISHNFIERISEIGYNSKSLKIGNNTPSPINSDIYERLEKARNQSLTIKDIVPKNTSSLIELSLNSSVDNKDTCFQNNLKSLDISDNPLWDLSLHKSFEYPLVSIDHCMSGYFGYTCSAFDFTFLLPLTTIDAVENISMANGNLSSIPRDFFKSMSQLRSLDLHGNNLNNLDLVLTTGKLEYLDLSDNKLPNIPNFLEAQISDLTSPGASMNSRVECHLGQLVLLNMSKNDLSEFDPMALCNHKDLQWLDVSGNHLESVDAQSGSLCVFENLEGLYLADNHIPTLPSLVWAPNVKVLDLSSNMIKLNSSNRNWQNVLHLQALRLNNNPLRELHADCFLHLTELQALNLANCLITHVHEGAFRGLNRLQALRISHNEIIQPEGSLLPMESLAILEIQHNRISDLLNLQIPKSVRELNLSYNKITTLTLSAFASCTGLTSLMLAGNNISMIDMVNGRTFPPSLHTLNLSENRLAGLGQDFLVYPLESLSISHNQLRWFDADLLFMVNILDLSWNKVTDLSNWTSLPDNMLELRLSGNPWPCDCASGPRLQQFILEHSDIIADMQDMQCYQDEMQDGNMTVSSKHVAAVNFMPCHREEADARTLGAIYPVVFLSLLLILVVLMVYFREWIIFQWYMLTGLRCECSKTRDNDYEYDIFINYSRNDRDIGIMKWELLPMLEKYYTTWIPDRDWPIGDDHCSVIEESIQSSRNVILLISDSFCRNKFCMFTFRKTVVYEKLERSSRLILIQMENRVQSADEQLKQYLKSKRCVTLTDQKFKKKLLYLIPKFSVRSKDSHGTELMRMNATDANDLEAVLSLE